MLPSSNAEGSVATALGTLSLGTAYTVSLLLSLGNQSIFENIDDQLLLCPSAWNRRSLHSRLSEFHYKWNIHLQDNSNCLKLRNHQLSLFGNVFNLHKGRLFDHFLVFYCTHCHSCDSFWCMPKRSDWLHLIRHHWLFRRDLQLPDTDSQHSFHQPKRHPQYRFNSHSDHYFHHCQYCTIWQSWLFARQLH